MLYLYPMNIMKSWLRRHTKEENQAFADKIDTSLMYLEQIGMGIRTPSPKMAEKLAEASDNELDKMGLLFPNG